MGLSCGAKCLKFCLMVFNFVFLVCGLVCLVLGVWLIVDRYAVDNLATATARVKSHHAVDDSLRELAMKPTAVRQIGYLVLGCGLAVILVSFMGCCGAAKEWRPLLCCYATCLMFLLALEIAAGIYAAMHSHMFEKDFRQILHASLRLYNGTNEHYHGSEQDAVLVKTAWDKLMQEKNCCGVDSRLGEFRQSGWFAATGGRHEFPPACCPPKRNGKLQPFCHKIARFGQGCYERFRESIVDMLIHFKVVMWTAVSISLIQVVGVFVAFCLCNSIEEQQF